MGLDVYQASSPESGVYIYYNIAFTLSDCALTG